MISSGRLRLRSIFQDALLIAAGTAACGGSAEPVSGSGTSSSGNGPGPVIEPGTDPTVQPLCASPTAYNVPTAFPKDINPQPVDYLEERSERAFATPAPDGGPVEEGFTKSSLVVSGAACAGATDKAACQAKLDAIRVLPSDETACVTQFANTGMAREPGCSTKYLIYTRGDEVTRVVDVKTFLGPIDTKEEALWILQANRIYPQCSSEKEPAATIKKIDGDGFELRFQKNCEEKPTLFTYHVKADGTAVETKRETFTIPENSLPMCWMAGRRPAGYVPLAAVADETVGDYFASIAELEAASIVAFRRLHRQLARHGAPKELLARLRRAARDEIRHTRTTRMLARRYGNDEARRPCIADDGADDLLGLALENAREGCVRETFGALVARYQAMHATDAIVRDAMGVIAEEETQHAELSWDIAAWLDTQLSPAERQAVSDEKARAQRTLAIEAAQPIASSLEGAPGLPSPATARRLAITLDILVEAA